MTKAQKNAKLDDFSKLDKDHRTFVELTVNESMSNKELAARTNRKREATMSDWKKSNWYQKARDAYIKIAIKGEYKVKGLQTILNLLDAKSEMVRLQAATTLLKMAGMLSDNDTPELTGAKIRKANADARVAEARAKAMEDNGQDMELLLDKLMDKVESEDQKHGTEQSADS